MDPDGERRFGALLTLTQRPLLVESNPDGGHQVRGEAVEPGVHRLVGGPGFTGDIAAVQGQRPNPGAVFDDVRHHVGHDVVILRGNHAWRQLFRWNRAGAPAYAVLALQDLLRCTG